MCSIADSPSHLVKLKFCLFFFFTALLFTPDFIFFTSLNKSKYHLMPWISLDLFLTFEFKFNYGSWVQGRALGTTVIFIMWWIQKLKNYEKHISDCTVQMWSFSCYHAYPQYTALCTKKCPSLYFTWTHPIYTYNTLYNPFILNISDMYIYNRFLFNCWRVTWSADHVTILYVYTVAVRSKPSLKFVSLYMPALYTCISLYSFIYDGLSYFLGSYFLV